MNIFVLDQDPRQAARYHCDKHVNKMLLESAQMLCAAINHTTGQQTTPYRTTHLNHPCTQWVLASRSNAAWLLDLAGELNIEWRKRFRQGTTHTQHKSWEVLYSIQHWIDILPYTNGTTPFAQAMPEEFKQDDAVQAYRAYYHTKTFAEWRHTSVPSWYQRG